MTKKDILVFLNTIPKLGSLKIQNIAVKYHSYAEFLKAKPKDLMEIEGIGKALSGSIIEHMKTHSPEKEMERAKRLGVKIVTLVDNDYPEMLKQIYDPPPVLYVKGKTSLLSNDSIAIVGSRKASAYGKNVTVDFAKKLASTGLCVVSGMARGIDSFAHKGAIEAGGPTVAVFGSGIDTVYPPENKKLMERICECGCVISCFPFGTPPLALNFPARNRIISGLSLGIIVIEAANKSGSLITADFALEQGREVFAVPGNIFSPYSRGTHKLIKQGAKLVENIDDVLEELFLERLIDTNTEFHMDKVDLSKEEQIVYDLIDYQPVHIEQLISKTQMNSKDINAILTRLELKGNVAALNSGYFVRN